MTTVGITGSSGLVGWHVRCGSTAAGMRTIAATRETFASDLEAFVSNCDVIVHAAAMNRGEPDEIQAANVGLTELLVDALERTRSTPHVIHTNSVQQGSDTPYGRSKERAAALLARWSERSGRPVTDLVLPHVFGEHGRPYHNSVVSTFCHRLASEQRPEINDDAPLELVHAQRVADVVVSCIADSTTGSVRIEGRPSSVRLLATDLSELDADYRSGRFPDLVDDHRRDLFNTLRSFMPMGPRRIDEHTDDRGRLVEVVKCPSGGQTFFSETVPGITRGNHYHRRKVERFCVVSGRATIRFRRLYDDAVSAFDVTGAEPVFVDIPTLHTHDITNTGEDTLLTLFWSNEIFDPDAPDTFAEPVVA